MESTKPKTKLDLITGFLGAGKTTFIRRYARWLTEQGIPFAIIENEFGTAGVDTAILREEQIPVSELSGGCICCSQKINFHDLLLELSHSCERILIEPSGIFDIRDFYEVAGSVQLEPLCEIGCVITIADPASLENPQEKERQILQSQLSNAGCILLSKTRKLSLAGIRESYDRILSLIGRTDDAPPIICKDWEDLTGKEFDEINTLKPAKLFTEVRTQDHASLFNSTTLYPTRCFGKDELSGILEELTHMEGQTVLRVKGYVNARDGFLYCVNCTATEIEVVSIQASLSPMINIIGRQLKRERIRSLFS